MQNAEGNPTQRQQTEMAAKSPVKTPAAGSVSPDASTQAKEFGSRHNAKSAEPNGESGPMSSQPGIDVESFERDSGDPVQRAASRIVGVGNRGTDSTDDSVDADAKSIEAKRDLSAWHDNVITSNATLENNVPAPASGLGGIDSRETGNGPAVLTRPGYRVIVLDTTYDVLMNGSRTAHLFRIERE